MDLALTLITLAFAFTGEAVFGFGAGLIALPILSQIYPIKVAVTLLLSFQFVVAVLILKSYQHIAWDVIKRLALPTIVFVSIGAFSLTYFSDAVLRMILLVFIVLYLLKEIFFSDLKLGSRDSKGFALFGGLFGGWFQGVLGTGGPGYLIYLNELGLSKAQFRVTILLLFFICNFIRTIIFYSEGLFTPEVLKLTAYSVPVVGLSLYTGYRIHHGVSEFLYRKVIYGVLTLSAVSIGVKLLAN